MKCQKLVVESRIFGRRAQADVFELGTDGKLAFVLFGGSGVDQEEYERRLTSTTPIFNGPLNQLERDGLSLTFIYVSAPYDVPIRVLPDHPAAAQWNAHLSEELLPDWIC